MFKSVITGQADSAIKSTIIIASIYQDLSNRIIKGTSNFCFDKRFYPFCPFQA